MDSPFALSSSLLCFGEAYPTEELIHAHWLFKLTDKSKEGCLPFMSYFSGFIASTSLATIKDILVALTPLCSTVKGESTHFTWMIYILITQIKGP